MNKTIIVRRVGDGYQATIKGEKGFGTGRTINEAIGDLVRYHTETFGVTVEEA